jgi:hypothetical protein
MGQHFESLNRASRVFSANSVELATHIAAFVGVPVMQSQLGEEYEHELVRLFHNYLASIGTLRDVQRAIHRSIWPMKGKDKPSDWESKVYGPKVQELLGAADIKFLQDLRNYTVHYTLPVPNRSSTMSWSGGGPVRYENRLTLDSAALLKWGSWTSKARKFIADHEGAVEFLPAIENYSVAVREFFQWFWDTISRALAPELQDAQSSGKELHLLQEEQKTLRNWMMARPPAPESAMRTELRRRRVIAQQTRWAHGSRGWRVFAVNPRGSTEQINEDPWGLPPVSRRFLS